MASTTKDVSVRRFETQVTRSAWPLDDLNNALVILREKAKAAGFEIALNSVEYHTDSLYEDVSTFESGPELSEHKILNVEGMGVK